MSVDMRGRPRDYNSVARHRDLLQDSIDLAVPKLERLLASPTTLDPWTARELLRQAIHDLTVGTE